MCNTSKKSSEKSSFNFEIILEVFFLKNEKKKFFHFSIMKISWFLSFLVNFLKAVKQNWKKIILRGKLISEKLKKFCVHSYTPQNTTLINVHALLFGTLQ